MGSCVPFVFPWASQALFLTLHSHGLLLNSLGFPSLITLSHILWVHGLAINPLLSLLSLLWVCRGPFSLFHIIYCPWFAFSLFSGSFKPIYLLKAHLFISWVCDPLFLLFGLNGFSIRLSILFCSCCWASSFDLGFRNGHQQFSGYFITWTCSCIADQISSFMVQNYHLTPYLVAKQCSWWCYLGGLIHSSATISTSCGQDVFMERVMWGV